MTDFIFKAGLIFTFILITTVKGTPVRIQQTSSSLNINGKTMAKDIFRELAPEVEAPIFGSFEFGLGRDKSSNDRSDRRRRRGYNRGDYISKLNEFLS